MICKSIVDIAFNFIADLRKTYIWAGFCFFLTFFFLSYNTRFLLLIIAFIPITVSHFYIYFKNLVNKIKLNPGFLFIGSIWLIKIIVLLISGVRVTLLKKEILIGLEWIDLFFLNINLLIIFGTISFKYPLFYKIVKNKVYRYLGIIGGMVSLWLLHKVISVFIYYLK